jgi:hypothetical protein
VAGGRDRVYRCYFHSIDEKRVNSSRWDGKATEMGEDDKTYYITKGPIRGSCKHQHRTIYWAYHCLRNDFRAAQKDGIFSDRRVYAVENRHERELYEHEINELDHLRRVMLKKTAFQQ